MSAVVIDLALERAKRTAEVLSSAALPAGMPPHAAAPPSPFLFWTGSSGSRYVHTVYALFECPPVETANYILAKRHSDGRRTVVSIGRVASASPTLNLAEIRMRAAELGANEVHVHLLAGSTVASHAIETDLRGSLVLA